MAGFFIHRAAAAFVAMPLRRLAESWREAEHKRQWPQGHMVIDGHAKTEQGARDWESTKTKTITPPRGRHRSR